MSTAAGPKPREVVETAPGRHTVFQGSFPEVMFYDVLDARIYAAMVDVLDRPSDNAARLRLRDCVDILVGLQVVGGLTPRGKRVQLKAPT